MFLDVTPKARMTTKIFKLGFIKDKSGHYQESEKTT
jgi:hypothetical protein